MQHAIAYYRDFVRPAKQYREPTAVERAALADLAAALRALPPDATAETIQDELYAVGKRHPFPDLRAWFVMDTSLALRTVTVMVTGRGQ